MRRATAVGIATALVLLKGAPGALAGVEISDYSLSLLDLPPDSNTPVATARAINAEGRIVGWYGAGPSINANPLGFLAQPDGTGYTVERFPTPTPPSPPNYPWVQPYDISTNNRTPSLNGLIVGQSRRTDGANTTPRYAFGKSDIATGLLGTPLNESEATGINADGQVVGWRTLGVGVEAFYFDGNTASPLPPFTQASVRESRALGINDEGHIVGHYVDKTGPITDYRGFVYDWNAKAVTAELGLITVQEPAALTDWLKTYDAVSINNQGRVAATQQTSTNLNHAVLFDGTKARDLGVTGEYEESFAAGISDTGWVVGFLTDADKDPTDNTQKTGFLWAGGRMFDLSRPEDYGLAALPEGYRITVVHDAYSYVVDEDNPLIQKGTLVGEAIYQGNTRGFAMEITLQVPEPHTYLMLGLGLLAIGTLRMRRLPPH
jgi:probable HAF family extracellular repeat protein